LGAVALSLVMPVVWVSPQLTHWPLFALMGALGGAGHFALIKAFQRAPAAVVAPFSYVNLIWAIGFGFILFAELPDPWTVFGASIIAGGGLYILHRERVKRVGALDPAVNTPPPVK
jgi:drug/metabolite transporter (DMT)-like permease